MASWFTPEAKQAHLKGLILATDTYKLALYAGAVPVVGTGVMPAYTVTNEISGAGYSAGGAVLAGYTVSIQSGIATLDFTTATWPASTLSATYAVLYDDTAAPKYAMGVYDFGGTVTTSGTTFFATMPPSGSATSVLRIQ